ncbi:MAG: 7-carboxy-7-deazaguanine synthase QueE [Vicingaceae bacterium]
MTRLPVMESFLTIQGEGYHQGRLAYFIRLAGCDVGCTWCDVKDSWSIDPGQWKEIDEVSRNAAASGAGIAVITGGEPLMHDLSELTIALSKSGLKVHLETSGAYPLSGQFDWICHSPKKFKPSLKEVYESADELKVIVVNKNDLVWAQIESEKVTADCLLLLQAEWEKREKIYPLIYSYIAKNPQWRISVQSHKYLGLP